ncbi:MAG: hypothetical protein PHU81_08790 [Acidobacteriota bacterium]|nr:hypothetical protein [Acidobacteriota bacterium]
MPKLSEQLTVKERRFLSLVGMAGLVILGLLIITFVFWNRQLNSWKKEVLALQSQIDKLTAKNGEKLVELKSWQETKKDLDQIEKTLFYVGQPGMDLFRQDLSQLFQKTGLPLPAISYQYEEDQKKQFRRLSASFGLALPYPVLKKFLYELESWPRIWLLDQINFQKIDNLSGVVSLRLAVAGFYYEK